MYSLKFQQIFNFNELLKQLIIRDVKLKYRRSYLGYLWSVLNPLMLMMVLVVVFSNLFRFDIPNFPLYLICGQIVFNFMAEATNMAVGSVIGNAALIKKTYVPKYIFTVARIGSSLVNFVFSLGALICVMLFTQAEFSWYLCYIPIIILQLLIFSLGLGLWLSAMTVFFRDIQYLWNVFITMWMYLTPIFYPYSIISKEYQSLYQNINPMFGYLAQFRDVVLYAKAPSINSILVGFAGAFIVLILGAWYFNKKQDEFILYI